MQKKSKTRSATVLQYVGANVRRLRSAKGWTQKDLADETSFKWRAVQDLERGSGNPSLTLLIEIAQALRAPIADLFAPTEVPELRVGRPWPEK